MAESGQVWAMIDASESISDDVSVCSLHEHTDVRNIRLIINLQAKCILQN